MIRSSLGKKQKIILCISGMTGCGKSTVSKLLAKKYNLRYFSGGDALKALALKEGYKLEKRGWWETEEGAKFLQRREQNSSFDKNVDTQLLKWAKEGNVVLDSWTMPWLYKKGFKIWLDASPITRAKRIAERDKISVKDAFSALKLKDVKTKNIFEKLYGFKLGKDFSPFNMILDVGQLSAEEVYKTLNLVINRLVLK